MKQTTFYARIALLAGAMLSSTATVSFAGAQDYEFQAVRTDIKQGAGQSVSVRLIDKRTGKTVPDAVIFTTRMDMAPEGMEMMTTTVDPSTSAEPGVYAFTTNLSMEGGWRFQVAAKVQGEPETVKGEVVFKAVP
ncbi:FixH family protein [Rhizobium sp. PL01]|uniref:FixH family protein n=1 Tax=Rhizobium sp. PL01 TaxID=3085631 RepID=UPI002980B6B2|nr:FixH family protein [Rhizobium sp. PL01]MDW5317648.1 FixH family protein [Rhizobium sp. PL01]